MTASMAPDLRTGVATALDAMTSGEAVKLLERFVEASRG
jgi:anthranilate phosphoribosyltransferase